MPGARGSWPRSPFPSPYPTTIVRSVYHVSEVSTHIPLGKIRANIPVVQIDAHQNEAASMWHTFFREKGVYFGVGPCYTGTMAPGTPSILQVGGWGPYRGLCGALYGALGALGPP